jgi:hypothetical protein
MYIDGAWILERVESQFKRPEDEAKRERRLTQATTTILSDFKESGFRNYS